MAKKSTNPEPELGLYDQIIPAEISTEMKQSFIEYSMSVITSRALPDVRDGLKPVHRRILYGMYKMGLTSGAKFKKSAAVVGEVLGKYHPHGDISVYDAMVNMAQPFSYRYPLVLGQGNFGSLDGDGAAAMRYTEAKMSKTAEALLDDLEKETVNFSPNYDGFHMEPTVLPAAAPALLLNGVLGIAVGMASNIPPHNAGEVMNAALHLLDNPDATTEDLLQFVQGPDFPTGAIIYNARDIANAYATGRGAVVCRGEAEVVQGKGGKSEIVITSIPYRVNRAKLIVDMADLVQEKKLKGIRDIRDESTDTTRIVVEIRNGFIPEKILNYIYKHTELQVNFNFNMTALVDGVPQILSLREILYHFLQHRYDVVKRRSEYDLARAEARAHILEGLSKALDHIDEIIKLIKKSADTNEAKAALMSKFKFSEIQAIAILEMKLQKLAGLERKKIEDELAEKKKLIAYFKDLLAHDPKMWKLIGTELEQTRDSIADVRRTKVVKKPLGSISDEDLVPNIPSVIVMSADGYIKRTDPSEFKAQRRGGVGVGDLDTKDDDMITTAIVAEAHSDILFFTNKGKVYAEKCYEIPEGKRATKGKAIQNLIPLGSDEIVTSVLELPKELKGKAMSLVLVTKAGEVKRTNAEHVANLRRSGLIIMNLDGSDQLLSAHLVNDTDDVLLVTAQAQSIRFAAQTIRMMGRSSGGVKGISLGKEDSVVGVVSIAPDEKASKLLVLSQNGFGKKTKVSEYKTQNRGGSGILTFNVTDKTGTLVGALLVNDTQEELIAVSAKSQVVRTSLADIPVLSRATQGVRIMKVKDADTLASVSVL
jgi:DNA gyrase subunit A